MLGYVMLYSLIKNLFFYITFVGGDFRLDKLIMVYM